jgi:hypothetical protein
MESTGARIKSMKWFARFLAAVVRFVATMKNEDPLCTLTLQQNQPIPSFSRIYSLFSLID